MSKIPLIYKIVEVMKGFPNNPDHVFLNKSDKEVAAFFKGLVSRYLKESKQQLIEDDLKPIINESKWMPDGVDKNKTYSGVKFSKKNSNNFG